MFSKKMKVGLTRSPTGGTRHTEEVATDILRALSALTNLQESQVRVALHHGRMREFLPRRVSLEESKRLSVAPES